MSEKNIPMVSKTAVSELLNHAGDGIARPQAPCLREIIPTIRGTKSLQNGSFSELVVLCTGVS